MDIRLSVTQNQILSQKMIQSMEILQMNSQELNEYRKKIVKKNKQAAKDVLDDFEYTIKKLKYVASSLNVCDNPRLQSLGYRRINFQQHRYFMLYRIENDVVYVDDIFHELQDYENKMI